MILDLRFLSGEKDDFIMDMQIDSHATFAQLHKAIQQQLNYDVSQMASFVVTDFEWNQVREITLVDMAMDEDQPAITMENTVIEDHLQDSQQRFMYLYDFFSERCLFMEVTNMTEGTLDAPVCIRCEGEVPEQIMVDNSLDLQEDYSLSDGSNLYDEMDEFDEFDADNHFSDESFDDDYQY